MAAAVCLMLLLPDELLTKIIIHSIRMWLFPFFEPSQ
jgi:hypothetical protein